MKFYFRLLLLALTPFFLFTCEDPVTLDSRFEAPELVVEAWINNQRFYRVRAGLYRSMALAEDALSQLEKNGYPDGFVVAR